MNTIFNFSGFKGLSILRGSEREERWLRQGKEAALTFISALLKLSLTNLNFH